MRQGIAVALVAAILLASGPAQAADAAHSTRDAAAPKLGREEAARRLQNDFSLTDLGLDLAPETGGLELQRFLDERSGAELQRLDTAARLLSITREGSSVKNESGGNDDRQTLPLGRAEALSTLHLALAGVSDEDLATGAAREQIAENFTRLLGERDRTETERVPFLVAPAQAGAQHRTGPDAGLRRHDAETSGTPPASVPIIVPKASDWRSRWRELGHSFHQLLYGESLATAASIAMAIVVPAYAMAHFGIAVGVAGQLINIGARVAGSKWGAKVVNDGFRGRFGAWLKKSSWMVATSIIGESRAKRLAARLSRIDEKTLYIGNIVLQVANTGAFIGGFFLFGVDHWAYAGLFILNQVVHGFGNGSIDNMASSSIKPRVVAPDEKLLRRANFVSQFARAGASLISGLVVSKVFMGWLPIPPELQILVYAGLQLATIQFFRRIKLRDKTDTAAAEKAAKPWTPSGPAPARRDYLASVASQFATTTFWTLFTSAFAVYIFGGGVFNGWSITAHLAGSTLANAVMVGLPKLSERISPRSAFALLVVAQGAVLYAGLAGNPWLYFPAAFSLGAMIDINKGRTNTIFQAGLHPEKVGPLAARLGKWGMGLAVPLLVFIGAAKIFGGDVLTILTWAALATFGIQATLFALSFGGKKPASTP